MKMLWMIASISLLLVIAYNNVRGAPREAAQNTEPPVATPVAAGIGSDDKLSPKLSEYLFLHQTRYESIPFHAMADVNACSK